MTQTPTTQVTQPPTSWPPRSVPPPARRLPTAAPTLTCSAGSSTRARGQDLRDFLLARLFTPLGIGNPQWQRCPLGYSLGATGLQLRTEEIARLGRTLLHRGRFKDQQLIPAEYADAMISDHVPTGQHLATGATEPHPENSRYGRHAWLCERDAAWRMDGMYGQFSVILPRQHACVTVTSHYERPTTDILDAIWSDIVPALG